MEKGIASPFFAKAELVWRLKGDGIPEERG
jgi:hypothetical protein